MMNYRVERWSARGVQVEEAETKREANFIAERMRSLRDTVQTTVVKPNGDVRACRNVHYSAKL